MPSRAPLILLLLVLPLSARAQAPGEEGMITLDASVDPSPFADTSIYAEDGSAANGAGQVLPVGQGLNDDERRTPFRFDFAGRIPIGSDITHVVLTLTEVGSGSTTVDLHRLSADWGEGSSNAAGLPDGAPAAPGDATWTDAFFDSTPWSTAGGDFEAAVSGSLFITSVDFTVIWDSDVSGNEGMVADVQHWLQNPSQNFGWILIGDLAGNLVNFASRERVVTSQRPVVSITYIVPEPGSIALLTLGLAALAGLGRFSVRP
jgi:hypothetical protein